MSASESTNPLTVAVEQVGDRWSLLIVQALLDGPRRFGELGEAVARISPNILSQRLKHLEGQGLVLATPYSRRPPRFAYELTAPGRELASALRMLAHWGAARAATEQTTRHEACGTPAEARWWCPTCDRPIDEEATELRHL
ncbi:MAG: winged helix-turn-helix transcriptional regulator [Egibacteraceae bacterium]